MSDLQSPFLKDLFLNLSSLNAYEFLLVKYVDIWQKPTQHCKAVSEVKSLIRVQLFATPWTVVYQAPPSMGFSRKEYWSGLPFPSPGDLPDPGIEPRSPALQALTSEPPGKPLKQLTSN